jgi:thiosulfate/3-mercaptopyruvate sulfurtransferase
MDQREPVFVSSQWLADHLSDSTIVVVDARPPFFYAQGHLQGSVSLPLLLLAAGDATLEGISKRLGAAGIAPESHVVIYDDGASPTATHAAWLLISIGHPAVSVLDGGITKWASEDREVEYAPAALAPATYTPAQPSPDAEASFEDVLAAIGDPNTVIVDVRRPSEFLGAQATARRNGHVPGALNIEWSNNLDVIGGIPRLRGVDELRTLYTSAGVTPDKRVIVYCQSGNRSTFTWMALKELGYEDVLNYASGWQEWGNRPDSPVIDS